VEEIKAAIEAAVPGAGVEFVSNPSPCAQHSLRIAPESAVAVATFLRDDAEFTFDFLSNVSGVDWPDKEIAEKVKVTRQVVKTVDGVEQTVEETVEETRKHIEPGCLEAVYHLFSVEKKHGPLVIRMRTAIGKIRSSFRHSHPSGARPSSRSAKSSISMELLSPVIPTCAAF